MLVKESINDRVGYISLNRPEKRNALSAELVTALIASFTKMESDENVKVIVLSGEGEAFCAGADLAYLKQLHANTYEENLADSNHLRSLFSLIYNLKKVVIAKVTGHAIAGGAGLATVCDVVFSVPEAKMGYTEVKIGFVPAIVSIFLIRKLGDSIARELMLSGRLIDATEAQKVGMVNFISSEDNIHNEVDAYAKKMVHGASGDSLSLTKGLLKLVQDHPTEKAMELAAEMNAKARATKDCQKGIAAFLNKEKIIW